MIPQARVVVEGSGPSEWTTLDQSTLLVAARLDVEDGLLVRDTCCILGEAADRIVSDVPTSARAVAQQNSWVAAGGHPQLANAPDLVP